MDANSLRKEGGFREIEEKNIRKSIILHGPKIF